MSAKIPLNKLLDISQSEFLTAIGGIYEKSPWIVESFYNSTLSPSLDAGVIQSNKERITNVRILFNEIETYMRNSSKDHQLQLLKSHPDLCLKIEAATEITEESKHEQKSAGLSTLTAEERETFTLLNNEYKVKFPFPFILAVRNASKQTVLSALRGRVNSTLEQEMDCALFQVNKIAWMRLLDVVDAPDGKSHGGFLTCHVLDTANGIPASGMVIELYIHENVDGAQQIRLIKSFVTNSDGRLDGPALKGEEFKVGTYEWKFYVGDYFAQFSGSRISGTPFLDVVPLKFGLDDPTEHYHVPLLASPWSYSTYRGS
jgi:2-oxo-4-hydroxy-4-carboxy-5-ureidoimidazoline decarboxylase